jgi:NAD(P)H-dependent FMN reductase
MSAAITIISGTNRPGSASRVVAERYQSILAGMGVKAGLLSLEALPDSFMHTDLYGPRSAEMQALIDTFISEADTLVFVIPEYNGSYPGVLKMFLDGLPPRLLKDKKAGIIGLSDGAAGNLRGQEHLTGVLHYLKMHVHYAKPKLSSVEKLLDGSRQLADEKTLNLLADHARLIVAY